MQLSKPQGEERVRRVRMRSGEQKKSFWHNRIVLTMILGTAVAYITYFIVNVLSQAH